MASYDAIVIGGGLGGLTAGAKLAREGQRVLLLEQYAVVGGYATTYRHGQFKVEVGLHELDGLDVGDHKHEIFHQLGVFEGVQFVRLPEFYRLVADGIDFVMPDSADKAMAALTERFPHEKKGIAAFFERILKTRRERARLPSQPRSLRRLIPLIPLLCPNLFKSSHQTLTGFLDAHFRDDKLKLILATNFGYYGDNPDQLSMLYFSFGQASYFVGGSWFIKGGSQELSNYLARDIEKHGGTVMTRTEATRILLENGRATGVRFKNKRSDEEGEARAPLVVANAAMPLVARELLPADAAPAFQRKVSAGRASLSLICLYLGFNRPLSELGHRHYSTFVMEGIDGFDSLRRQLRSDYSQRGYSFVDYGQADTGLAPPGKGLGVLVARDWLSDWESLSEPDYQAKKQQVERIFRERLEKLVPGINEAIEWCEVATPRTMVRYTRNPHGSVYGFAQLVRQSGLNRLDVRSPIKGLYFGSAWSFPGGGFSGAIYSGWLAAQAALEDFPALRKAAAAQLSPSPEL